MKSLEGKIKARAEGLGKTLKQRDRSEEDMVG